MHKPTSLAELSMTDMTKRSSCRAVKFLVPVRVRVLVAVRVPVRGVWRIGTLALEDGFRGLDVESVRKVRFWGVLRRDIFGEGVVRVVDSVGNAW